MRRDLSSGWTGYYKFVTPALWVVIAAGVLLFPFRDSTGAALPAGRWFVPAALIATGAWLYRWCASLKKLAIEGRDLIVSNYSREVRVPLARIRGISETKFSNPRAITIELAEDCEFGSRIRFLPKVQYFLWPWQEHPTTTELRKLSLEGGFIHL